MDLKRIWKASEKPFLYYMILTLGFGILSMIFGANSILVFIEALMQLFVLLWAGSYAAREFDMSISEGAIVGATTAFAAIVVGTLLSLLGGRWGEAWGYAQAQAASNNLPLLPILLVAVAVFLLSVAMQILFGIVLGALGAFLGKGAKKEAGDEKSKARGKKSNAGKSTES